MNIRRAVIADSEQLRNLFYDTITTINSRDYSPEQVAVWAAGADKADRWLDKIKTQHFYVAEDGIDIIGFASATTSGYLDFMFVHKDRQGQGIATRLLREIVDTITRLGRDSIVADVSITAKPFFLKHGFVVDGEQTVMLQNVPLTNYKMVRSLNNL